MELTLRKAHALSQALLDTAKRLPLPRAADVSIYTKTTPEAIANATLETLDRNLSDASDLIGAAYELRALIGAANHEAGINHRLTEAANLKAQETLLAGVVEGQSHGVDLEIAGGKLETMVSQVKSSERVYGHQNETLAVRLPDAALIEQLSDKLRSVRRRKIEIADELLALNTSTRVSVSPFVNELLTRFKLV